MKWYEIVYIPTMLYQRVSPSLSDACTNVTRKPTTSDSVTIRLWSTFLMTGGFLDSFGDSTT